MELKGFESIKNKYHWTDEEIDILKKNFRLKSDLQLKELLRDSRSLSSIKSKRREIGLINDGEYRKLKARKGKDCHLWKGGKQKINCAYCNKEIERSVWDIKRSKNSFCNDECLNNFMSENRRGENHPRWNGGVFKSSDGYIQVLFPSHPYCDSDGYVKKHRLVVEEFIGRYLIPGEVVHHINSIRDDNRIENLMLFNNSSEHIKFHTKIRQFGYTNPIKRQIENRWDGLIINKECNEIELSDPMEKGVTK